MQDKAERRKLVMQVRRRWEFNKENLGEWDIRRFAASEATVIGYSGVSIVSEATGLSRNTIMRGINEINDKKYVVERQPGGGRLKSEDKQEGLLEALEKLLEWNTFGDPECSLQWTIKSLRTLAKELRKEGFTIGPSTVSRLLADLGYSLQSNKKALNGSQDENRDAQFKHINERIKDYRASGDIIISVDSKNKVYIGNFKNNGQTYRIKNDPVLVNDHDFHAPGDLKAIPYGIYDVVHNVGYVSVGFSGNTAAFAVESIDWALSEIMKTYPGAKRILITCDSGGCNSISSSLWKYTIGQLAMKLGIPIEICHFPVAASKWNSIEHCLFSFISMNWRGIPLTCKEVLVSCISGTKTSKGLKVFCRLDENEYKTGTEITDEMRINPIVNDEFLGKYNSVAYPDMGEAFERQLPQSWAALVDLASALETHNAEAKSAMASIEEILKNQPVIGPVPKNNKKGGIDLIDSYWLSVQPAKFATTRELNANKARISHWVECVHVLADWVGKVIKFAKGE